MEGEKRLNRKTVILLSVVLVGIIVFSCALNGNLGTEPSSKREFYVGVELAYGDLQDLEALVQEVKNYTNLIILGLPGFSINQTLLNISCDYIYDSGLHFIVLFTNTSQYSGWKDYTPAQWALEAQQRYGDKFLAVYRWDEPGGDQLDRSKYQEVTNATDYADATAKYIDALREPVQYYQDVGQKVVTADYGLYWFDYKAGYDVVLAEFGWNHSRELQVALCRGAARTNDKDWGAMMTWTYSQPPYIESGEALYADLVFAYNNGAKYAVVFSYPEIETAKYGILCQEHLDALKRFWAYVSNNESATENRNMRVSYVLPADYGFGFRSPEDTIWGLWKADNIATSVYSDVNNRQYRGDFDILFDYPTLTTDARGRYDLLIYWNGTQINP